ISLVDSDVSGRSGTGLSGSGISAPLKDDTALAADLGLTGSLGGVPSPGRPGGGSPSPSSSIGGTRAGSGINVLGESFPAADPAAQTAISGGSIPDQVSLEGVGSGSGLLDLTRESDDTSLGAELLDEIAPGGSKRGTKAGTAAGSAAGTAAGTAAGATGIAVAARGARAGAGPIYVEQRDPLAPAFGGAALAAAIMVLFGGFALTSAVLDTRPTLLNYVDQMNWLILSGIGIGFALVLGIIGAIVGRR
ncbi:MAG TPA: hypothetical protein VNL70_02880, partial [Tepidisphaeraceae bacterium]|nr:hypothetical protein [Tepidisphaeraceae bacterium]